MKRVSCSICLGQVVPGSTCPRSIPCPTCKAPARKPCRRPSEHEASTLHTARYEAAEQMDLEKGIAPYPALSE